MAVQKIHGASLGHPGVKPYGTLGGASSDRGIGKIEKPLTATLMEEVVRRENLLAALKRVPGEQGQAPGIDGMTVEELPGYLKEHGPRKREALSMRRLHPPTGETSYTETGGGTRELRVPVALDRCIQQAVLQVLTPIFDPTFSPTVTDFGREKVLIRRISAKAHTAEGYAWVVDCDLEKFFDRVNHGVLFGRRLEESRTRGCSGLSRDYLNAGVMVHGVVIETAGRDPAGRPSSPMLSNLLLDELDKELERRGHRFCRYADDCNVYVKTKRAGERVFTLCERFL